MSVSSTSLLPILRCSASTSILTQLSSSNRISTNAVGGGRYGIYDKNATTICIDIDSFVARQLSISMQMQSGVGQALIRLTNALLVEAYGIVMRADLIVVRDG
ncbi:hypothetical protein B296_00013405 [Ensete ventricosum]|uniref:Uncharacterized protein n=1 Tax=Ensete ventricosum TaxID=4639 RepID=A0A427B8F0_ENSVE|nr:hypothetical protein B296_00013405 [Ensete ventricosum]